MTAENIDKGLCGYCGSIIVTSEPLREIEKKIILRAIAANPNRTQVAKALGVGVRTLQRKLRSYGVEPMNVKKGNW